MFFLQHFVYSVERVWMVQTESQYICIYQCLLTVLEGKENTSPVREIHDNQGYEGKELNRINIFWIFYGHYQKWVRLIHSISKIPTMQSKFVVNEVKHIHFCNVHQSTLAFLELKPKIVF